MKIVASPISTPTRPIIRVSNYSKLMHVTAASLAIGLGAEIIGSYYQTFPLSPTHLVRSFNMHQKTSRIKNLQDAYKAYLTSTTELKALDAAEDIFRLQRIILWEYDYPPKEYRKLCSDCQTHNLTTLKQGGSIHYTPAELPTQLKDLLAILGVDELVNTEVKHIFFVKNATDYPEIFGKDVEIKAITDPITRSMFVAVPDGIIITPELAPVIGHEAWHIRHFEDYARNRFSERDAYPFEIKLLKDLLNQNTYPLSPKEIEVITRRILLLNAALKSL